MNDMISKSEVLKWLEIQIADCSRELKRELFAEDLVTISESLDTLKKVYDNIKDMTPLQFTDSADRITTETRYIMEDIVLLKYIFGGMYMFKWIKSYYTRKDTRVNFMLEDLKLNLIGISVIAVAYYGYNKYLDWKDRKETEKRIEEAIEKNDELQKYINEED